MTRWLWVVAIALLAVRMSDAHLHMCFDGQEPRSAVHVGDRAPHHGSPDGGSDHNDTDVALGMQALLKSGKVDFDDLPLAAAGALVLCSLLLFGAQRAPAFDRPAPFATRLFQLRPPPRGPPSLASL